MTTPTRFARGAINTVRGLWIVSRDLWRLVGDEIELHRELARRHRDAGDVFGDSDPVVSDMARQVAADFHRRDMLGDEAGR